MYSIHNQLSLHSSLHRSSSCQVSLKAFSSFSSKASVSSLFLLILPFTPALLSSSPQLKSTLSLHLCLSRNSPRPLHAGASLLYTKQPLLHPDRDAAHDCLRARRPHPGHLFLGSCLRRRSHREHRPGSALKTLPAPFLSPPSTLSTITSPHTPSDSYPGIPALPLPSPNNQSPSFPPLPASQPPLLPPPR